MLIALLFNLPFAMVSISENNEQGVKVSVTNIRNNKGYILISIFKDGVGFPDKPEKAVKRVKFDITNNKAVVMFPNLSAGNYAVAILHDENNDQKLNKNILGIPKEGFGFSNNVIGTFGPPSFFKASFQHQQGQLTQITIRTKYF